MNTILVPTDFSKAAKNALNYAIVLANRIKADIVLLNTYTMPRSGSAVMIDVSDVLRHDSLKMLTDEQERVSGELKGGSISSISHSGSTVSSIAHMAKEKDYDLIVMGTTGATGLKEAFIGSNTSALIKELNIPIIAVPASFTTTSLSNVTVSTDLEHLKSSSVFQPLKTIMNGDAPHISIINVSDSLKNTDPTAFVEEALDLDDMFFGIEHSFKFIENSDIEKGILEFVNQDKSELLVVVSRKRNFFEQLFHKSISKKLTMHSNVPIMVLSE